MNDYILTLVKGYTVSHGPVLPSKELQKKNCTCLKDTLIYHLEISNLTLWFHI